VMKFATDLETALVILSNLSRTSLGAIALSGT